jgi:hypothetical protein
MAFGKIDIGEAEKCILVFGMPQRKGSRFLLKSARRLSASSPRRGSRAVIGRAMAFVRQTAIFLLRLFIGWFGTAAHVSLAEHPSRFSNVTRLILQDDLLSGIAATSLGFVVSRVWYSQSARWVWLASVPRHSGICGKQEIAASTFG